MLHNSRKSNHRKDSQKYERATADAHPMVLAEYMSVLVAVTMKDVPIK